MNEETAAYRFNKVFMAGFGFFSGMLIIGLILGMAGFTAGYFVNVAVLLAGCCGSVLAFWALRAEARCA